MNIMKKTIERLEKDVARYQAQLQIKRNGTQDVDQGSSPTRYTSSNYSTLVKSKGLTPDVTTEKFFNEVELALVNQGLDIEEGLKTFRKFVGQLKSEIHILKIDNGKKDGTIRRYRQMMNENLVKTTRKGGIDKEMNMT